MKKPNQQNSQAGQHKQEAAQPKQAQHNQQASQQKNGQAVQQKQGQQASNLDKQAKSFNYDRNVEEDIEIEEETDEDEE